MTQVTTAFEETAFADLGESFRGELVRPGEGGYEEHRRVWNGSIDRRPVLIARCVGVADVIAAVRFASRTGILTAVRGGGHNFAGKSTCDDGLVIDLSPMQGVRIDPEARTARVEAGVLWGDLDHESQFFGLATTGGIVSHTGVAGLTLGGGIGWLMRKHGLTVDNLLSVDVVTASGELLKASETENAELFWGLRGGGGNFGVVTSFEFRLHPVGPVVMAGPVFHAMDDAFEVFRWYREWITDLPDEVTTMFNLRRAPALPFVPEELHYQPIAGPIACYAGPVEEGRAALRELKEYGNPVLDLLEPKPYVAHQRMFDPAAPHGNFYYIKSQDIVELTDEVIDVVLDHCSRISAPMSQCPIFQLGGRVREVDTDATAFGGRDVAHTININGVAGADGAGFEEQHAWARGLWDALQPHAEGGYVNFFNDENPERVREAYGERRFARLQALKRTYDPDNVFRLNENIPPEGSGS